jgi:hypothetical protein
LAAETAVTNAVAAVGAGEVTAAVQNLPDEILIKIFSHFDIEDISAILARVNWRWRLLASTKSLWPTEITLSGSDDPLWKSYLVLGGHHFKHVILRSVQSVEKVLAQIAGTCPKLETIRLVLCETQNPHPIDIEFPQVTAIYIHNADNVAGRMVRLIAKVGLPNLTTIELPGGVEHEDLPAHGCSYIFSLPDPYPVSHVNFVNMFSG